MQEGGFILLKSQDLNGHYKVILSNRSVSWLNLANRLIDLYRSIYPDLQRDMARYSVELPTSSDLQGAAEAMIRLQETYELSTNDTANGTIRGVQASQSLASEDCYEIGRAAIDVRQHGLGVQWLEKALEMGVESVGEWVTDALYLLGDAYRRVSVRYIAK